MLIPDWRLVLRKAWSVRLGIAAAFLSGLEVILPFFSDSVPPRIFALLSFVTVCGAVWARLVAQRSMHENDPR